MIWVWVILLFLAGVALILAEFVVPGAVCGIAGGILVIVSCGIGVIHAGENAVWLVLAEVCGVVVCIFAGFYMLGRTRLGKFLVLEQSQDAGEGWVAWETDESLVGATGNVVARLRPAGIIQIDGKRVDAVSTGEFIEKGARVRVTEVHGSRVVVERAENG